MDREQTQLYAVAMRTVTDYELLQYGDRIAVGVSGGADSVALLAFLCTIQQELALKLEVCHVNHCLRGAESDGDEAFVRALAQRLRLPFRLCSFGAAAGAQQAGEGVEEYSRNRRYAFFAECVGQEGRVATAHTISDSTETVLFNLIRGTGVKGLCGIARRRGQVIRPLRDCTREQVEDYLAAMGQPFRNDSTNATDLYSRNYIRHNVLPPMLRLNPLLHGAVSRMAEQMEQQWQMTAALAAQAQQGLALGDGSYSRKAFLELSLPVAGALCQRWLEQAGAQRSERLTTLMYRCAAQGSGAVELTAGVRFLANTQQLTMVATLPVSAPFYHQIALPQQAEGYTNTPLVRGKMLHVTRLLKKKTNYTEKFYNKDLKCLVECDKIKEPVFVHQPRVADSIFLQGREHSLLHRYRTGSKAPDAGALSCMAVVEDAYGVAWAERLGRDERRTEPQDGTECYRFEVLEDIHQ